MTPKPEVCELLIQDAEHYTRIKDGASKKKTLFLSVFAVCAGMAIYALTGKDVSGSAMVL